MSKRLLKLVGTKAKNFTEGMKDDDKETPQHTKGKEKQWNTELSAKKETKPFYMVQCNKH